MKKTLTETVYQSCFNDYCVITTTARTIHITLSPYADYAKQVLLQAIARALEEETGLSYEAGDYIDAEEGEE